MARSAPVDLLEPEERAKRRVTSCFCLEENCHACVADTCAMGWRHRGGSGRRLLPAPRLACDRVVNGGEGNMATTSQKKKVEKVMHEHKRGTLKSGSGKKVKSRKQAIAIAMSESGQSRRRKPATRKTASRKTAT